MPSLIRGLLALWKDPDRELDRRDLAARLCIGWEWSDFIVLNRSFPSVKWRAELHPGGWSWRPSLTYQAAPAHCDAPGETGTAMLPGDNGSFWRQVRLSQLGARLSAPGISWRERAPEAKVSQHSGCRPGCLYWGDPGAGQGSSRNVWVTWPVAVWEMRTGLCAQRWGDFYPEASLRSLLGPTWFSNFVFNLVLKPVTLIVLSDSDTSKLKELPAP